MSSLLNAKMNFSAAADYSNDGRYRQRESTRRFINKLTFGAEDVVLDVGCGTGEETKEIAKYVRNVIGVDASEEMLAVAKETNASKNVTYYKWDARTVGNNPEWRERFDKVVSFHVLHWFPEHSKALAGILACLKPGGEALMIIDYGDKPAFFAIRDQDNRLASSAVSDFLKGHTKWAKYVKNEETGLYTWKRSCQETEDFLKSSGWTNVECLVHPVTKCSELQAKLFFKTVFGETSLIPESMQEEYLEDLWQWALSEYEDESQPGHVRFPVYQIVIHARKPSAV